AFLAPRLCSRPIREPRLPLPRHPGRVITTAGWAGRRRTMSKNTELLQDFGYFAQSARTVDALMDHIVQRLHATMTRYNWVGFYLLDKTTRNALVLGPHVGSFEPHERVSLEKGLCGAAATSGKTVVVNNVANDPRYLAGSELVKSEIVVPIFARKLLF